MNLSVNMLKVVVAFVMVGLLSSCISKKKYEEAMTRAAAEKSALESSLAAAQEESESLKGQIETLEGNLNMKSEEIISLSEQIKDNNAKIAALQDAIKETFSAYDTDDIKVEEKNGKLYITMANKILFEAGRDRLKKESKEVIASLAGTLKDNADLSILVEGHTDSDPVVIHKARYKDNWQLSVARSLNVVRELVSNGVNEGRLTASGKGETMPVADNMSDEGKEKNRRTEFVIIPAIDGLYKMYKEDFAGMGGSN